MNEIYISRPRDERPSLSPFKFEIAFIGLINQLIDLVGWMSGWLAD